MYSYSKGVRLYKLQPKDSLEKIAQNYQTTIQEITKINPDIDMSQLYTGQKIRIPHSGNLYQNEIMYTPIGISRGELILSNHMRLLWEQHVFWTRMFILSVAFGLPDTEMVTRRLLRNPKDFEAALAPFYGVEIASTFEELFTQHLTIAAELVNAAKAGDSAVADDAEKRWYENADQIAAFLASINPYWSEEEWKNMLYSHLTMTKEEAVFILTQKFEDSITIFDNIELEALAMADMMTQGIVEQFPEYFTS